MRPPRSLLAAALLVFVGTCVVPPAALLVHLAIRLDDPQVERVAAELIEPELAWALLRTLGNGALAAGICVVLGVPYAVLLARTRLPGRRLWEFATFLGLLIPPYFATVAGLDLLGREGAITRLLGWNDGGFAPLETNVGVVALLTAALFPVVPLLTTAALRRVRPELEETALLETGVVGVLRRVTIPAVLPEIAAAALLVFVLAINSASTTDLLVGARSYGARLSAGFLEHLFSIPAATVLALPLIGATATALLLFHFGRRRSAGEGHLSGPPARDLPLSRAGRAVGLLYVAIVWAMTVGIAPWVLLRKVVPYGGTWADGWAVYRQAWPQAGSALVDSLWIAGLAGAVAGVVALLTAGGLNSLSDARRRRLSTWLLLPAVVPASLFGIGLIFLRTAAPWLHPLLGHDIVLHGASSVWVVHTAGLVVSIAYLGRFLPFAVKLAEAGLSRLDPILLEAAAVDGATAGQTWRRVILPTAWPYAAAAGLLVFALSLGELDALSQVVPPRMQLLSQQIYEQAHRNLEHNLAGQCLVLLTVITAAAGGMNAVACRVARTKL